LTEPAAHPSPRHDAPRAVLISQGDEVVTGQIVDTNAAWLAELLTDLGVEVRLHLTAGDRLEDLEHTLRIAAAHADLVVCTGGLGPTDDDLTAESVARTFGFDLAFDDVAWQAICDRYARFGRPVPPANRKQALLPQPSRRLDNAWGTAPGFEIEVGTAQGAPHAVVFAFLPGVPSEMKPMFLERVLPAWQARLPEKPGRLVTLRTTGVGESVLQERMNPIMPSIPPEVVVGYRTMPGENLLKLRFAGSLDEAQIQHHTLAVLHALGRCVFAVEGVSVPGWRAAGSLIELIAAEMNARGATLAVAESCTGGRVAALCTQLAGSSAWFHEGVVTYANEAKVRLLGVPAALLAEHGAVSEPVARAMAEGVRARAGTTYGVAITGIAGPGGGSDEKPVGTVHLALATPDTTEHLAVRLGGRREMVQTLATHAALDLLRRHLLPPQG
jgi:nicotinamide-nucleotide amidase